MKPSVVVALLVGLGIGFAVGRAVMPASNSGSALAPSAPTAQAPSARPTAAGDQTLFKVEVGNAYVEGKPDALVTMVEFSDYECPFCGRANVTVKQLREQYGDKLRVAMKHNPLSFHPRARPAALAALAAGEQGKFWELHHKMFDNQRALDDASLEKYATEIGLNVAKWKSDMQSSRFADVIAKDQAQAAQLGATGTPAFFINGRKVSGAQPIENFKKVIDEELARAEALVKAGTPANQVYAKAIANGVTSPPAAPQQPAPQAPVVRKIDIPADSPAYGPKYAKVTIVEWSDFQCPFCSRAVPTLEEIKKTYGKDVRIIFRNQPLPFHQFAKGAAEAAMAAHAQGKFWEMHDKMFANNKELDRPALEKYAAEIGLNVNKFKADLDSGKYRAKVEADSSAGAAVGANGTPTFFINGRQLVGAQPFPAFKAVIDEEIAKADKLLGQGVKLEGLYDRLVADAAAAAPAPAAAPQAPAPVVVKDLPLGNAPTKGPKNAPVTIAVWSDFQCPFCSRAAPTLKRIEEEYKGKVRIAFKNQPLPFHQNAKIAATAALAANEQGKFWEMHDKLFANQQQLDRPSLERYAQELGLDMNKFKTALDTNKFDAQITQDSNEGMKVGANGTPTFFINGRQVVGAQPFEAFKAVIDEELKKAGK